MPSEYIGYNTHHCQLACKLLVWSKDVLTPLEDTQRKLLYGNLPGKVMPIILFQPCLLLQYGSLSSCKENQMHDLVEILLFVKSFQEAYV